MAYKKYRLSTKTIVASLTLMFVLGFFLAYNIANIQHNFFKENKVTAQAVETVKADSAKITQLEEISEATTKVLAVSPQGEGLMGSVTVNIRPGKGEVLIDINPFLEPDTQYSASTAVEIAKEITKENLEDKDVIINFDINGTVLGGPSAGAATTIAVISAVEHKPIKEGIAITGTIEPDGTIGKVGSIVEKGEAAADNKYKTFLIPKGQNMFTYYERKAEKRQVGNIVFYSTRLVPKTVNLKEYFQDKGLNVIEVSNINDVISYML